MSKCPYTWFKSLLGKPTANHGEASELRVKVSKKGITTVNITLPAKSARWLIDVIPEDVVVKIRTEGIPIDAIQNDLAKNEALISQPLFTLEEPERTVQVWLE